MFYKNSPKLIHFMNKNKPIPKEMYLREWNVLVYLST